MSSSPTLVSVSVSNLFGRFDHQIDFPEDWPFAIVVGPNGVGKTKLFELVTAALGGNPWVLGTIHFDVLTLKFSDRARISFQTDIAPRLPGFELEKEVPFRILVSAELPSGPDDHRTLNVELPVDIGEALKRIERDGPIRRVSPDFWQDLRTDEMFSVNDVIERLPELRGLADNVLVKDPFDRYLGRGRAHLIETQRLIRTDTTSVRPRGRERVPEHRRSTVSAFSEDLSRRLNRQLADSGRLAQVLDRSFPNRLLKSDDALPTEEEVRAEYERQSGRRARLVGAGLLDRDDDVELPERKLNDTELRVMKTYLDDVVQKLSVFDAVLDRVDLLTSVLNEKLLFKTFRVSRDQGFVFVSDDGREIPLAGLSSGEQHELVLLYDLLFNVPTGSLVMIDEPEISLHVSWQRRFMADMQRIANIGKLRFVVATHSPQIVDEWWPYTIELARGWD